MQVTELKIRSSQIRSTRVHTIENVFCVVYVMPKMFLNVLFYFQFGCCIVELFEKYFYYVFKRGVPLIHIVRLFLPFPKHCTVFFTINIKLPTGKYIWKALNKFNKMYFFF